MMHLRPAALPRLLILTGVLAAGSCGPQIPSVRQDDAGDESFARRVVPVLQGRKIRGYSETKLLADLIQLTDRARVVRALMENEEFEEHWTEVFVDDLRVDRSGSLSQASCYDGDLMGAAAPEGLAQFVTAAAPNADFGQAFKMGDLIRSSIKVDNVYPVYRAHMFAMVNRPGSGPEQDRRNRLGDIFGKVYLNRELGCLLCHNSEYSLSGDEGVVPTWDRTHPIPGFFEEALYGQSSGRAAEEAFAIFRTDARDFSNGFDPFGLQGCGSFRMSVGADSETAYFTGDLGNQVSVRNLNLLLHQGYLDLLFGGLDRELQEPLKSQCENCEQNCQGTTPDPNFPNNAANAAQVKSILLNNCAPCHTSGSSSGGLTFPAGNDWHTGLVAGGRVTPGDSNNSLLIDRLTQDTPQAPQMPLGGTPLSNAQINTIRDWIDDLPADNDCAICGDISCTVLFPPAVKGVEAFAFLTAARVVDNVWQEAIGHPLTIANYFPRNVSQRNVLWNLTEYNFIPNNWSLKELLVRILTTDYFNRRAPFFNTGSTPYELPAVFDPWTVADPRQPPVTDPGYDPAANPENHHNAMGEGAYRYSARNLFHSVHEALDWPAPERFPPNMGYPDADLARATGQYFNSGEPGFQSVDLQGLLRWESSHGVCEKPAGVGSDWIDHLMTDVAAFPANDPGGPLTLQDVTVVMRDWLLGDGTITTGAPFTPSELTAWADYFGQPLSTPASSVSDLEGKMRGACGVMIETAQWFLHGVTTSGLGVEPRLRVCNPGAPCTYQEMCQAIKPAIDAQLAATSLSCGEDSVGLSLNVGPLDITEICPPSICGYIPMRQEQIRGCLEDPEKCVRKAPGLDPRCQRIDCGGGPLPPIERRGYLVAWAEGAQVRRAQSVRILRRSSQSWEPLEPGVRLQEGDLLSIPPGAGLSAKLRTGSLPAVRVPKDDPVGERLLLITGSRALSNAARPKLFADDGDARDRVPADLIERLRKSGRLQSGEIDPYIDPTQWRGFRGEEERSSGAQ